VKSPLHLLLDGVDNVGKSTVAGILSRKLSLPIVSMPSAHKFFLNGNIEQAAYVYNLTLTQFKDTSFIMDRGFPASIVYSKVYRRPLDHAYIAEVVSELDPEVFILLDLDVEKLKQRGDEIIDPNLFYQIQDTYHAFAREHSYRIISVNGQTSEEVANRILQCL
jgi:thymidylate kinase